MQKIKVAKVDVTTGTKKDGNPWTKTTITDDKGAKYSGFDSKLSHISEGAEIEIEPEIDGKYINIKEFKVLSAPATTAVPTNGKDMSKEDWAMKDRTQRESIEAQTAVKSILDLAKILPQDAEFKAVYQKALKWCDQAIDKQIKPPTKLQPLPQPPQSKSEGVTEESNGNPPTDLFAWLNESMGKNWKEGAWRSWLKNVCKIDELLIDIDPAEIKKQVSELQGWI